MANKSEQAAKISSNIKKFRDEKGWNQATLADKAGISGAALSKIEKGDGRVPTIVVLRKIASALNIPPHEITGEKPEVASEADERNKAFYRKWDLLEDLEPVDEEIIKGMAARLKGMTKSD